MTAIVLVTWFASAVLTPLGRADLGAAKFLAISGASPWMLAVIICGIAAITAALITRYFRVPASPTPWPVAGHDLLYVTECFWVHSCAPNCSLDL
jgi:hypothetical protein